jgi:hypothetical protein
MHPKAAFEKVYIGSSLSYSFSKEIIVGEDNSGRKVVGIRVFLYNRGFTSWRFIYPFKTEENYIYFWDMKSPEKYEGMTRIATTTGYKFNITNGNAYSIKGTYDETGLVLGEYKIENVYQYNHEPDAMKPLRVQGSEIKPANRP